MRAITSRQHPLVKACRAAARGDGDRALLDGWHLLHEAVAAGMAVEAVALAGTPVGAPDAALVDRLAAQHETTVVAVSDSVLKAMSPVRTPSGVVALVRRRSATPAQLTGDTANALVVVAVDVQDPGNAGAIVRSAEAGGATGVVLAGESADPWSWKALRASMGSTFRLPVVRQDNPRTALGALRDRGLSVMAAVPRGGAAMDDTDLRGPVALLVGAEGRGLPDDILAGADARVSIPMAPAVDSLNVAVAVGVLVFEARRQRASKPVPPVNPGRGTR